MLIRTFALRRRVRAVERRFREARALARSFQWPHRPIVAQIIPTRRCNLSCSYCNEFDRSSDPVPLEDLRQRIDKLAELGTAIITLSGGEPLLHPHVDEIVHHIRRRGAIATLITNGYLLTSATIEKLNAAGLDSMQINIDGQLATHYLYGFKELEALQSGGVQRVYLGNLKAGTHEIVAFFTGKGPHERDYKRGATVKFDKGTDPKYIELRIKDSTGKLQPEFDVKVWQ